MAHNDALSSRKAVADYYGRLTTRVGYNLFMGGSKHFGFYDEHHQTEKAAQARFLEKFIDLLDPGRNDYILDAGCGQGLVATQTARISGAHVTGLTVVPFEVPAAEKYARRKNVSHRTHFLLHDYAQPLPNGEKFDRIYTVRSLLHAPNVQKTLKNLYNHLRPGGRIVCIEYEIDYDALDADQSGMIELLKQYGSLYGISQFAPGQFMTMLSKAGFQNAKQEDWTGGILPSMRRIRRLARPAEVLVSRFQILEPRMVNTTIARHYVDMAEQGRFWFKAYTAVKPSKK